MQSTLNLLNEVGGNDIDSTDIKSNFKSFIEIDLKNFLNRMTYASAVFNLLDVKIKEC
jgi:hypothetical protein